MSSPARPYTRLPGARIGLVQRASLWLGADHVLVVHETMTGESYRRFFFRDIRTVVVRETSRGQNTSVVLLALTVLSLVPLLFLTAGEPGVREVAWLSLGALLWIVLLLIHVARGPTCETRFRTLVQDDIVTPLARTRTTRRVLETLRPRILAAQAAAEPVVSPETGDAAP